MYIIISLLALHEYVMRVDRLSYMENVFLAPGKCTHNPKDVV